MVSCLFAEEPVPKAPDGCALGWSDATLAERGPAAAGVVSSGLFWWELSVPSLAERVPPDKNLVYERVGLVARGYASFHWSWRVGFAVQVRGSVNQGRPRFGHRKGVRKKFTELCEGCKLRHAHAALKCGVG